MNCALAQAPADLPTSQKSLGCIRDRPATFSMRRWLLKCWDRKNGIYRNSVDADFFFERAKPSYIGGVLEMSSSRLRGFWGALTEAIRTGEFENEAKHRPDFFGALYAEPARPHGFLGAMTGISAGLAQAIGAKFAWNDYSTFAGQGYCSGHVGPRPSPPQRHRLRSSSRFSRCSRNSSLRVNCRIGCGFKQEMSSRTLCRTPM
jgi:hypothetical protein